MSSFEDGFKAVLLRGNPIREIGAEADRIALSLGIPVVRLHLGNPSTTQFAETKEAMLKSISSRVSGYGPHPGSAAEKQQLADFFNDSEGVPDHFIGEDAIFFPGATLITKALGHIFEGRNSGILLSSPGYPVYENQALADGLKVLHYQLDPVSCLVSFESLDSMIRSAASEAINVRAVYITFPHNPTGKALTEAEALTMAGVVNRLNEAYPSLVIYNDSVYSATCAVTIGYNSIYPFLSDAARQRTISGVSGAKLASLGGERVGGVVTKNVLLRTLLTNAQSQMTAGVSVHSIPGFLATTCLFKGQWKAGQATEASPRACIANFYQERISLVARGLGPRVLPFPPGGGMYVYADFAPFLKGKLVPPALQQDVGSATLETGRHLRDLLLHADKLGDGYVPVATVNGEVFGEDASRMTLRISCVERSLKALDYAVNTLRAVLCIVGELKDWDLPPPVDWNIAKNELL